MNGEGVSKTETTLSMPASKMAEALSKALLWTALQWMRSVRSWIKTFQITVFGEGFVFGVKHAVAQTGLGERVFETGCLAEWNWGKVGERGLIAWRCQSGWSAI